MSAGTVVIAGGILATVILLTIVAVLCLCRLQYYCCKREESEKGEEAEPALSSSMSPARCPLPLAPSMPPPPAPSPPLPERYSDESDVYPPTFLTEANGPAGYSPPPPPPGPPALVHHGGPPPPQQQQQQRSHHTFCPSCARHSLPFYLQHPAERLCNGGRRISYRTVQQQELDLPCTDMASFYQKLNLIRSVTMREVVTHSVSTDV